MHVEVTGEVWYWRGPAPFHFVTVPDDVCEQLAQLVADVSYGWGMIPVAARLGSTRWTTSLWPKDGRYIVPVRTAVRRAEGVELGDVVTVELTI